MNVVAAVIATARTLAGGSARCKASTLPRRGYRARINRVARVALIVGLFAVLFAPGALDNPTNSAPEDVAAAVLAPTSADLATVAPAVEREVRVASVLGTLVALALVVARRPRRLIRAERWPWQRVDTGPGVFRRRGPPLSFT